MSSPTQFWDGLGFDHPFIRALSRRLTPMGLEVCPGKPAESGVVNWKKSLFEDIELIIQIYQNGVNKRPVDIGCHVILNSERLKQANEAISVVDCGHPWLFVQDSLGRNQECIFMVQLSGLLTVASGSTERFKMDWGADIEGHEKCADTFALEFIGPALRYVSQVDSYDGVITLYEQVNALAPNGLSVRDKAWLLAFLHHRLGHHTHSLEILEEGYQVDVTESASGVYGSDRAFIDELQRFFRCRLKRQSEWLLSNR